jgi:hypothetical protein
LCGLEEVDLAHFTRKGTKSINQTAWPLGVE